jgi:oligopeptide/dipeptide ABC transporter ATP-binding protein
MNAPVTHPLLRVEELRKSYPVRSGPFRKPAGVLRALDGISFDVGRGETFGLVGESGCGKSTAARCMLRLVPPTSGSVIFDGVDVLGLDAGALRRLRRRLQIVFQDSSGALDGRMTIGQLLEEPLVIHDIHDRRQRRERVLEMLAMIGLRPEHADRKPHQFSGGQRQRIGLARALVLEPELIVLDEPISALDVSVQAQILNLLKDLQRKLALTYIFIVHDLTVAELFCDRIAVLYLGRVMELASAAELFRNPQHPYTVSLISAAPVPGGSAAAPRERIILSGEVSPLSTAAPRGCPFRPRCPVGRDRPRCAEETPPLDPVGPGHRAACHYPGELKL